MNLRLLLLPAFAVALYAEGANAVPPDAIVQNYCDASRDQTRLLAGVSMDVDIEASLPKLKKEGRLHALRKISALGRITYQALRFDGDNTIKKYVIDKFLSAEAETQKSESPSMAVTPENYKFKYRGRSEINGAVSYVFQVTPRRKRVGLFRGDIWVDAASYLRVQESGYFVKNPSVFLKRVAFVRKYEIRDGISVPRQIQSVVDTRLAGKAELNIEFSNFSLDGQRHSGDGAEEQ